jgi:hypothetical protein
MKYYFLPCLITISIIVILLCRYFKQENNEGFINESKKITRSNKITQSNKCCDCQTIDTNSNNIKVLKQSLNKSDITLKEIQRKMKEMTNTMNKGQRQAAKIKQKSNNTKYSKQKKT